MSKNGIPTETCRLTLFTGKGQKPQVLSAPSELPSDAVPGEFLMIPDAQNIPRWYVLCDKQRWWANGRWNVGGTLSQFDPSSLTEAEMYKLRRSLLQHFGWTG